MNRIVKFDEDLCCFTNMEYTFALDLEKGEVDFNHECYKILDSIESNLGGSIKLKASLCISTFCDMLMDELDIKLDTVKGVDKEGYLHFKIPSNLPTDIFRKIRSFEGVVSHFRGMRIKYVPEVIKSDKELLAYFKPCPVCTSEGYYKDELEDTVLIIDNGRLCMSNAQYQECTAKVNYCPICGREIL